MGKVYPGRNYSWPAHRDFPKAINIEFITGYGLAVAVPEDIKQAILLIIGHMERNREDTTFLNVSEIPQGAKALLAPYKIFSM